MDFVVTENVFLNSKTLDLKRTFKQSFRVLINQPQPHFLNKHLVIYTSNKNENMNDEWNNENEQKSDNLKNLDNTK